MSVKLRRRGGVQSALLDVLMFFPHQKTRELASRMIAGLAPVSKKTIKPVVNAIKRFDAEQLALVDRAGRVPRALRVLERFATAAR